MLIVSVVGTPAPQGSKRHVGNGVMVESSKKVKPWRQDVRAAAIEALPSVLHPLIGPVCVRVTFYLPRPRGHYGTGRNAGLLRKSAPTWPAVKPDVDKLLRSTLDALGEAGVWRDDSQVVGVSAWKRYDDQRPAGASIVIESLGVVV